MPLPRTLARFNRRVTNPIQRLWAGRLPGFGIVEHVGRRSGTVYRTPVNLFELPDGFVVAVNYGVESDWVQNLLAAGDGHVVHRGRRLRVGQPTMARGDAAVALLPPVPRFLVVRLLGVRVVLTVTVTDR